jgi:uncharacterized protein (TIGR03437 family)
MKSYGFQLTARYGTAGTNQAGGFAPADANTQVMCADGSTPTNGAACPSQFPVEDIEHTLTGWSNSISQGKGSFTYTINWTPPATNVGNVTLYIAANCGTGGPLVSPTHVYLTNMVLTPGAAPTGPTIANVEDAESSRTSVVPGEWIAIYGSGLAGTSRTWAAADFNNGNNLPMSLSGVSVQFGTLPAAVYYISPTQIDVQAPSGISGTVPVTVTNNGTVSSAFNTTVLQNAPALFYYPGGSNTYPAATHLNGSLIGDPAVTAGTTKASAGETIVMYVNGLATSPSGVIISAPISYSGAVTVNVGTAAANVTFAGLVAAGEYQLNVQLPSGLTSGNYPVTVSTQGQTSPTGIILPVGP